MEYHKYLKYKTKYLQLKQKIERGENNEDNNIIVPVRSPLQQMRIDTYENQQEGGFTFLTGYYAFFCNSKHFNDYKENTDSKFSRDDIYNLLNFKGYSLKIFTGRKLTKAQGTKMHLVVPRNPLITWLKKISQKAYIDFLNFLDEKDFKNYSDLSGDNAILTNLYILSNTLFLRDIISVILGITKLAIKCALYIPKLIIKKFIKLVRGPTPKKPRELVFSGTLSQLYEYYSEQYNIEKEKAEERVRQRNKEMDLQENLEKTYINITPLIYLTGQTPESTTPPSTTPPSITPASTTPASTTPPLTLLPELTDLKYENKKFISTGKPDIDEQINEFCYNILLGFNQNKFIELNGSEQNQNTEIKKIIDDYNNLNKIDCCVIIDINSFKKNKYLRRYTLGADGNIQND